MKRIKSSITNASLGVIATVVEIATLLFLKQKFINELGDSVYGLDQFIKTIISALSLVEFGVESIICFSLYKPICEKNYKEIVALMQFYKKTYIKISFAVLILGLIFTPLLTIFTEEYNKNLKFLYFSYILFLITAFSSYFFSYSRTFLIAIQKKFILSLLRIIFAIATTIALFLIIIKTRDYILYLSISGILQILENIATYFLVKRSYPYLYSKKKYNLLPEKYGEIKKNMKALVAHRVGGTFVLSTDGMIVTILNDLETFGFFSNYSMIIFSTHKILTQIFDGIRASLGDFASQKNKSQIKKFFLILQTIAFIIYTWSSVFILNLCQPFIELWIGKDKQLSYIVLAMFVLNFYLRGFRSPIDLIKDVKGIYWQDRYKSIFEGAIKVVSSVFLGKYLGYTGVVLGTTISFVGVLLTVEPYIVYKYIFNEKVFSYYINYIKYFVMFVIISTANFFICSIFTENQSISSLMMKRFAICLITPPVFFIIFLIKTQEFRYLSSLLKTLLSSFKKSFKTKIKF
ncbi:MAG: hypothetical protein LBT82_00785 [Oscillospiraceae bacterium]|jgi:O-antigen/teichoic acid export membrane protein|nr:hypothetical protein [Oscillospiraceae bacterium]